jgi:hypothetical protein
MAIPNESNSRAEGYHAAVRLCGVWQALELLGLMQPTSSNYRIDLLTKSFSTLKQQLIQQQQQQQSDAGAAAVEALHEPWFGMEAVKWQVPQTLTVDWAAADVSADLGLPPPNPYIPTDFTVKPDQQQPAAADAAVAPDQQQQQQQHIAALPPWVVAPVGGRPASVSVLLSTPPSMILDKPGVSARCRAVSLSAGICYFNLAFVGRQLQSFLGSTFRCPGA